MDKYSYIIITIVGQFLHFYFPSDYSGNARMYFRFRDAAGVNIAGRNHAPPVHEQEEDPTSKQTQSPQRVLPKLWLTGGQTLPLRVASN